MKAWATGYLTDSVYIGYVPYNGGTFNGGNVYLTPLGGLKLTSDLTKNASTALPHWSQGMLYVTSCSMSGLDTAGVQLNPATYTVNVTDRLHLRLREPCLCVHHRGDPSGTMPSQPGYHRELRADPHLAHPELPAGLRQ